MAERTPLSDARLLLSILARDSRKMNRIDRYINGHHDDPYMPDSAGPEYKLLAQRSVCNWMPLVVETPVQMLYVDGVRPGRDLPKGTRLSELPEWNHWQNSRLDSRQAAIHRDALRYGHSFTITEKRDNGKVLTRGLSPRKTSAVFEDPANDDTPYAALTILTWPSRDGQALGAAHLWDETHRHDVTFKDWADTESVRVDTEHAVEHGASSCPVTRFAAQVDLDGRTMGVVEPMIVLQNRINQTIFDMLVVQTYGAFKVRTISGMAPPHKMEREYDDVTGTWSLVPALDTDGKVIMDEIQLSAMRILFASDPETKFGSLDETPLDGYLAAIGDAYKTLSALAQMPPHYVLGVIPNIAAEAMQAAETTLERRVALLKQVFGESHERNFRLASELGGSTEAADDYRLEVIWRDTEARALAKTADAFLKLNTIGVPTKALVRELPGMTTEKADEWEALIDEADKAGELAAAIDRNKLASRSARDEKSGPSITREDRAA